MAGHGNRGQALSCNVCGAVGAGLTATVTGIRGQAQAIRPSRSGPALSPGRAGLTAAPTAPPCNARSSPRWSAPRHCDGCRGCRCARRPSQASASITPSQADCSATFSEPALRALPMPPVNTSTSSPPAAAASEPARGRCGSNRSTASRASGASSQQRAHVWLMPDTPSRPTPCTQLGQRLASMPFCSIR